MLKSSDRKGLINDVNFQRLSKKASDVREKLFLENDGLESMDYRLTEDSLNQVVLYEKPKDPYDFQEYVQPGEHLTFSEISERISAQKKLKIENSKIPKNGECSQVSLLKSRKADENAMIAVGKFGIDKLYQTRSKVLKHDENEAPESKTVGKTSSGDEGRKYVCKITRDLLVTKLPEAFKQINIQLGRRSEKSRKHVFAKFVELEQMILNAYGDDQE